LLPAEDAGFACFCFCFRHHSPVLIQDGKGGVRKHVIRVRGRDAMRDLDGRLPLAKFLIGAAEAVHGIGKARIDREGLLVGVHRIEMFAFAEQIQRGVIMLFGGDTLGICGHRSQSSTQESLYSKTGMWNILRFLLNATRGHRLAPWRSPYLRWRIETYTGLKMDKIGFFAFWTFLWRERHELARFLRWTGEMENYARPKPKNP
jgi:hypothetical protein